MTDGLAILGAWLELAVVLTALGWRLLRRPPSPPRVEWGDSSRDHHPPNG